MLWVVSLRKTGRSMRFLVVKYSHRRSDASIRSLVLWVHPAMVSETLFALNTVCTMRSLSGVFCIVSIAAVSTIRLTCSIFSCAVRVRHTEGQLLRFDLLGPRSTVVLRRALHCHAPLRELNPEADLTASQVWELLKDLHSPASLPAGCILSLRVCDPRYFVHTNPAANYAEPREKARFRAFWNVCCPYPQPCNHACRFLKLLL